MRSTHSRTVRKTPVRFILITDSNWERVIFLVTLPVAVSGETISPSLIIPAKGATRLIRPNCSMAKSAILEQSFSFVTSHTIVRTSAFISLNSASAGARRDSDTSARSSFPPLPAQCFASASPIPPPPPVITATELVISNMLYQSPISLDFQLKTLLAAKPHINYNEGVQQLNATLIPSQPLTRLQAGEVCTLKHLGYSQ